MEETPKIHCAKCKYYQVTWDAEKPYGCGKLGFKSRIEPATYVVQISGDECYCFESKTSRKK